MRLFIVDRSAIMREKLLIDLAGLHGVEWVGMAERPTPSMEALFVLRPDAVLLSIDGADECYLRFVRSLKRMMPAPIVVVLSNAPCAECREAFIYDGADFFLDKAYDLDRIPAALGLLHSRAGSYRRAAILTPDEEEECAETHRFSAQPAERKCAANCLTKRRAVVLQG